MWSVNGNDILMTEGDFGIKLPITVSEITFSTNDMILFVIKDKKSGEALVERTFSNIQENTIELELDETETAKLPKGIYVYRIDWYWEGTFMCNIIPSALFRVVDKA